MDVEETSAWCSSSSVIGTCLTLAAGGWVSIEALVEKV